MSALSGAQHLASRAAPRSRSTRRCSRRLSRARLSPVRRARGARRYPGTSCRSHSSRSGVARDFAGRKADRRVRWPQLCGDAGDDLADRFGRRGFCLDPARARLSHGPPPAVAAEAGRTRGGGVETAPSEDAGGRRRVPKQRRDGNRPETPTEEVAAESPVSGDPAPSAALLPDVTPHLPPAKSLRPRSKPRRARRSCAGACGCRSARGGSAGAEPLPKRPCRRSDGARAASEAAPAEAAAADAAAEAAASEAKPDAPAEPELVEVWRPGGRSEERRPHHDRNRQRHHGRPAEGAAASRRRRRRRGRAARAAPSPRPPPQRIPQTPRGRAGGCRRHAARPRAHRQRGARARVRSVRRASALKARAAK